MHLLEIMIDSQEEEVEDVGETIENQEEQIEDNQETLVGDKEDNLDNLDLLDREGHSVNLVTSDNLEQQDRGDHSG